MPRRLRAAAVIPPRSPHPARPPPRLQALYSTIQFATALLAAFSASFLSNNEYMAQDLFIVLILALTLGASPATTTLSRKRPSADLLSLRSCGLAAALIIATFAWQGVARAAAPAAVLPPPGDDAEGTNSAIPITTSLFLMGCGQLVAVALVFADGAPWKRSPARNLPFAAWAALVTAAVALLLADPDALAGAPYAWLSLVPLPPTWRAQLAGLTLAAAATYLATAAATRALHAAGAFSAAQRRMPCAGCRRQRSLHRVLADAWARKLRAWAAGAPPDARDGWSGDGDGGHAAAGDGKTGAAAAHSTGLLGAAAPALSDALAPLDVRPSPPPPTPPPSRMAV